MENGIKTMVMAISVYVCCCVQKSAVALWTCLSQMLTCVIKSFDFTNLSSTSQFTFSASSKQAELFMSICLLVWCWACVCVFAVSVGGFAQSKYWANCTVINIHQWIDSSVLHWQNCTLLHNGSIDKVSMKYCQTTCQFFLIHHRYDIDETVDKSP